MNLKNLEQLLTFFIQITQKNRHYIFGGVVFLIFILDYALLMQPQIASLSRIGRETRILEGDISKTQSDMQRLDQYKKEVDRLKEKVKEVNAQIKTKEEIPLILEQISRLANKNGVKIDQMMPDVEYQEFLLEENKRRYLAIPISIEAKSGYHNLGRFLNQIEIENEFLSVGDFTIVSSSDSYNHKVDLTLKAIVFEDVR